MRSIADLRAAIQLKDGIANLNAGTCSPVSASVLKAVLEHTRTQAEDPVEFGFRYAPRAMTTARIALANYLDCDPRLLLLITNTSFAVNAVAQSIPWSAGDEIVMSDQEYPHYLPLWQHLAARHGLVLRVVHLPLADETAAGKLTPDDIVSCFAAAVTPRTRLLFFSHVSCVTGTTLPAAELCALARAHGAWSFVDGAHAPGLVPVSLGQIAPDFYAANIHKWMMGATSAAFLYVRESLRPVLQPLIIMGSAEFDWRNADQPFAGGDLGQTLPSTPSFWCWSHEYQGTRNLIPFVVIPEAIAFRQSLPEAERRQHVGALMTELQTRLAALGYTQVTPSHPELTSGILSFRMPVGTPKFDAAKAWSALRHQHQVEVNFLALHDGSPALRVCCAWFNTKAEIGKLEAALCASF